LIALFIPKNPSLMKNVESMNYRFEVSGIISSNLILTLAELTSLMKMNSFLKKGNHELQRESSNGKINLIPRGGKLMNIRRVWRGKQEKSELMVNWKLSNRISEKFEALEMFIKKETHPIETPEGYF
jgi:hypothetical protein